MQLPNPPKQIKENNTNLTCFPPFFVLKRLFIVLNYSLNNKYKNQKKK
ncbi:hypothetical protein M089_3649 [Bacteroides ovatus str. 3725 D9 iii]|nr:conserved domain protein [Bacteroides ovatus SD CMC 3f]KDS11533.1 hypothetical protein M082_6113 [Bacteroides fragilis str. 3725 D9 ii]KDS23971.1 hypothetical protein M088_5310 [Bacteroides ovatus str. 3725 D1 iv]KDS33656.1 hypothetical protein M089_3649 [Bacteroides ovatus str. 3725 D9 iii]